MCLWLACVSSVASSLTVRTAFQLPYVISSTMSGATSLARIRNFLLRPCTDGVPALTPALKSSGARLDTGNDNRGAGGSSDDLSIVLDGVTFEWPAREEDAVEDDKSTTASKAQLPKSGSKRRGGGGGGDGSDGGDDADDGQRLLEMVAVNTAASSDEDTKQAEVSTAAVSQPVRAVREMSMAIRKGELVAIVGAVGAGKSSLLAGLLGELGVRPRAVSLLSMQLGVAQAGLRGSPPLWRSVVGGCLGV